MVSLHKFFNEFYKCDRINGPEETASIYRSPTGSINASNEFLLPVEYDVNYTTKKLIMLLVLC